MTNVMELLLACFVENSLNIDIFCTSTKRSLEWNVKFGGGFFKQNYFHACHTRFAIVFLLPFCCVSSLLVCYALSNSKPQFLPVPVEGRLLNEYEQAPPQSPTPYPFLVKSN